MLYPNGTTFWVGYGSYQAISSYPLVEAWEAPWEGGVSRNLTVTVAPQQVGNFTFYTKMVANTSIGWLGDPSSGTTDQQGEYVSVHTIRVYQPTCNLTVSKNLASPGFVLDGPSSYTGGGAYWSKSDVPAGTYTIKYDLMSGYATPPSESNICSMGSTTSFNGTYIQPLNGSEQSAPTLRAYRDLDFSIKQPILEEPFQYEERKVTAGQTIGFRFLVKNTKNYSVLLTNPEITIQISKPSDPPNYYENKWTFNSQSISPQGEIELNISQFIFNGTISPTKIPDSELGTLYITANLRTVVERIYDQPDKLKYEVLGTYYSPKDQESLNNEIHKDYERHKQEWLMEKKRESREGLMEPLDISLVIISILAGLLEFWELRKGKEDRNKKSAIIGALAIAIALLWLVVRITT
jgi:hypothetical protein